MTYALGTSRGVITKAPLLLIDLETEEGVTGRSYLWCYFSAAIPAIAKILEEVARVVEGERLAPADLVDAVGDRRFGIAAVVLFSGEALLLRRGEDLAVAHHGCGGIVIKAGNAEDRRHAERACSAGCAAEASSPA